MYFHEGINSLSQSLTALTAPSGREPLARPETLRFSQKLCHHAKGPILEDDFPRPGEDVTVGDKRGNLASRSDDWGSFPKICFTPQYPFTEKPRSHGSGGMSFWRMPVIWI